ncbi:hypothetical protein AFCDBAGC_4887 [Methylobacterium cerastii]|uniref:Uncharacterized protein n=1 Tax=Methylobacterium cerastii TaxID=932741 RepID=A0ABQ4QQU9_9HYPH|nr:hypothetical protein [Methylobacterium cerastii]GJD47002.1 hypothetical protein AFCDBAGC_4887 [Methylobacterium cerastii]
MGLFVVIVSTASPAADRAVGTAYPEKSFRVNDTSWVISTHGETSRQVSTRLGFNGEGGNGEGPTGAGVVFAVDAYWGRFNRNLWEWMRVVTEESDG